MDIIVIQEKRANQWIPLKNSNQKRFFLSAEFTPLPLIQKGENIAKPVDSKSSEEDKKQIGPKNK